MTVLSLNRGNGVGEQSVTWRTRRQVGWRRIRRCHLNGFCKRILEGNAMEVWEWEHSGRDHNVDQVSAEPNCRAMGSICAC